MNLINLGSAVVYHVYPYLRIFKIIEIFDFEGHVCTFGNPCALRNTDSWYFLCPFSPTGSAFCS